MKKIFYAVLFGIIILPIFAQDISTKDVKRVSVNFMNAKAGSNKSIKSIEPLNLNNQTAIHLVHFKQGGWVLLSNDYRTLPVLGYSQTGTLDINDLPPALNYLINNYKKQIIAVKEKKSSSQKIHEEWQNNETKSSLSSDVFGLLKTSRGVVYWNQARNNQGGCSPSYNQNCPPASTTSFPCGPASTSGCDCDKKWAGCGAIAIGQIMWFWQYPSSYNWSIIPTELYNNTPTNSANELAKLIRDCGDAASMNYCCAGSWATTDHVVDAFVHFGFEKAVKRLRTNWTSNTAWKRLMRAELDAGRPILYRGGEVIDWSDWSDWGNVHYFVCDGYDRNSPSYFHFNWGWGYRNISNPDMGICFTIDNLDPEGNDYSNKQEMIIGISPKCDPVPESITSVPYNTVTSVVSIAANTISLPASGSTLVVEPGASLTMTAKNSITLTHGFHAKSGCYFVAKLVSYDCNCGGDISVLSWTNYFSCNGWLCYIASNANTYEFEAFNTLGQTVYQDAGKAFENPNKTYVWNGTGSSYGWHTCRTTFRNNCARELSNTYQVLSQGDPTTLKSVNVSDTTTNTSTNSTSTTINNNIRNNEPILSSNLVNAESEHTVNIFPNPNNGHFSITTTGTKNLSIQILDALGKTVYNKIRQGQNIELDLSDLPNGIYFIKLINGNSIYYDKIVKQ